MINAFRWSGFWANLHSLMARRRSYRRKLPNRPVVKSVIGGVIDEHRKLATVLEIIDATHWRGHWGGQAYECRQFPDTNNLNVDDVVMVHAMNNTTELFSTYFPKGEPELWFSPGSDTTNYYAQVWRAYPTAGGTPYIDYTIEMVWQGDTEEEYVTHIFWAKPSNTGYVCTYVVTGSLPTYKLRIYRITQHLVAPSIALVLEVTGVDMGINSAFWGDFTIDPVIDSAQFLNHAFLLAGGFWGFDVTRVFKFDLNTELLTVATDFPLANGVGGGIATDSGNITIFAHDGYDLYSSINGINWVHVDDLFATYDAGINYAMLTDWDNDDIYAGLGGPVGAVVNLITKRDLLGVWAVDLSSADLTYEGIIALANSWAGNGAYAASWAQGWGAAHKEVWEKPDAGVWAVDWTGPAAAPGAAWIGLATQGLAYYDTKMWGLWHDNSNDITRLYRRDGAGNWTLVQSWIDILPMYTVASTTGMTALPSVGAGATELSAMLRQHEVN